MVKKWNLQGLSSNRGSALVVSLILLVVLTMLAVQGMRTNVMQERMAGNLRERNLAFQAAEAALRLGERSFVGVADCPAPVVLPVAAQNWDGSGGIEFDSFYDGVVAENPVYNVGPPLYVRVGVEIPPVWDYFFPVTARGVGGQDVSVVVLESTVEPACTPLP